MRFSIICSLLFFWYHCTSQAWTGNEVLSTQAEVDAFGQSYDHIKRWHGHLVVGSTDTSQYSDITDLSPLQNLRHIWLLTIQRNGVLENLHGLEQIDSIGRLKVINNLALPNLKGLTGLKTIYYGGLGVARNPKMTSLEGIDSLYYGDEISITDNPALVTLSALKNMQRSPFGITIINNDALVVMDGFDSLRVGGTLTVQENDALTHFGGFPRLWQQSPSLSMRISDNPSLIDFSLINLNDTCLLNEVETFRNPKLESLKGLDKIKHVYRITISENPVLTKIALSSLVWANEIYISGSSIDSIAPFEKWSAPTYTLPAIQSYLKISECPKLRYLHNILPLANSHQYDVKANTGLVSIHEDAGPTRAYLNFGAYFTGYDTVGLPSLASITGFNAVETTFEDGVTIRANAEKSTGTCIEGFNNLIEGSVHIVIGSERDTSKKVFELRGFKRLRKTNKHLSFRGLTQDTWPYSIIHGFQVFSGFDSLEVINYGNHAFAGTNETWLHEIIDTLDAFPRLQSIENGNRFWVSLAKNTYQSPNSFNSLKWIRKTPLIDSKWPARFPALKEIESNGLDLGTFGDSLNDLFPMLEKLLYIRFYTSSSLKCINDFPNMKTIVGVPVVPWLDTARNIIVTDCDSLVSCIGICNLLNAQFIRPQNGVLIDNALAPCSDLLTIQEYCDTITSVTSLQPMQQERMQAQPNPLAPGSAFTLMPPESSGSGLVFIYSVQGKELSKESWDGFGAKKLFAPELAGIYFVVFRAHTGGQHLVSKLIVTK